LLQGSGVLEQASHSGLAIPFLSQHVQGLGVMIAIPHSKHFISTSTCNPEHRQSPSPEQ